MKERHVRLEPQQETVDGDAQQHPAERGHRWRPLHEEPEEEGGDDPRRHEAPEHLYVLEDASGAAHHRRPQGGRHCEHARRRAPDGGHLARRSVRPHAPLVEVDAEDRRRRVEQRVQRAHDGAEERREDEAGEPGGQEFAHHDRIGFVGVPHQLREEFPRHDSGKDDQKRDQQLDERRQEDASLAVRQAPSRQRPLRDELVQSPVEEVRNPQAADEDRDPGHLRVVPWEDGVQLVVRRVEEGSHAAHRLEAQHGQQGRAGQQRHALDQVRPHYRLEAAVDGVGAGERGDQPDADAHVQAEDRMHSQRARVQHHGQRHEDVGRKQEDRHQRAGARVVAVFEVLGDGVDARPQELGQEEEPDEHQRDGRHPLVAGDGQSQVVAASRHPHEVLGRDVGRDEREADQPPRQVPPRQEVACGIPLPPGRIKRNPHHDGEKADEGSNVERLEGHGAAR